MKKKLLFVIDSLDCDGASKSLVSLLNEIDLKKYDVNLMILNTNNNFFLSMVPKGVKIVPTPMEINLFFQPLVSSIRSLISIRRFDLLAKRLELAILIRIKGDYEVIQKIWMDVIPLLTTLPEKYDVAIGYQDIWSAYYVALKTNATKKIGWNHNDYGKTGRDINLDKLYLKQIDNLVTVSNSSKTTLLKHFPMYSNKIKVIKNIISSKTINDLADKSKGFVDNFNGIRILTIGRLDYHKGIDLAIIACSKLIQKGYNVRWYVIGAGSSKKIEKMIYKYGLKEHFVLLGTKQNPYPYIRNTDIYVQPSRSEGFGIALAEAKVLRKPIVVTDIKVFAEQIRNNENGIIVTLDSDEIFKGVKLLIENINDRERLIANLCIEEVGNEYEVKYFYSLIDS